METRWPELKRYPTHPSHPGEPYSVFTPPVDAQQTLVVTTPAGASAAGAPYFATAHGHIFGFDTLEEANRWAEVQNAAGAGWSWMRLPDARQP